MSKMKFSLYSAVAGFLISFLLGLIASVAIWVVFLRAFLLGGVLGGFVYLAFYLLEKHIPGLFVLPASSERDGVGKNVDITIDDTEKADESYTSHDGEVGDSVFLGEVTQNDGVLDELPNLSEFEGIGSSLDGDAPVDFVEEGTAGMIRNKGADSDSVNVDTMAKAIHTVLERES